LFYVLFVYICVLYYRHRVATQLQLTHIFKKKIYIYIKFKCKVTPAHTMKTYAGSGGMGPLIVNLSSKCEFLASISLLIY